VRAVPHLYGCYPGICLTTDEKARKNLSQGSLRSQGSTFISHSSFLLTNSSNSIEQSPSWEANSSSASTGIPRMLWNAKVHCRLHNNPLLVPILNQINSLHIIPSYFLKIHFNIILPFTHRSSKWCLSFWFSTIILYAFLSRLSTSCVLGDDLLPSGSEPRTLCLRSAAT
jgi:hypothetical protein